MTASDTVNRPTVLLVEDDPQLRRMLRTGLPPRGFDVVDAATGEDALALARERAPDAVLLDLALPGISGLEVVRRLRQWSRVPVIVLTARGAEQSKVELLDAGADDYVTKPFGFDELLARLRAALRRTTDEASADEPVVAIGPLRVDRAAQRVWRDGDEVHLSPTEFALLLVLARHPGRTVTHRQLLQAVWGTRAEEAEGRLRVYMTYLRRKLERDPVRPRLLVTQAGVGYRLDAGEEGTP